MNLKSVVRNGDNSYGMSATLRLKITLPYKKCVPFDSEATRRIPTIPIERALPTSKKFKCDKHVFELVDRVQIRADLMLI